MHEMPVKKKASIHRRLYDIHALKIGVVDRGANGREWLVVKRDGDIVMKIDFNQLTKVHTLIGQVISVAKSGSLDATASERLSSKMTEIEVLLKNAGFSTVTSKDVQDDLAALRGRLEAASAATGDLNVADEIDSIKEKMEELEGKLGPAEITGAPSAEASAAAVAAAVTAPVAAAAAAPQVSAVPPVVAAPAAVAAPAVTTAAATSAAPAAASPAVTAAPAAVAAAADAGSAEVVTDKKLNERLAAFKNELVSGVLDGVKAQLATAITTAKHASISDGLAAPGVVIQDLSAAPSSQPVYPREDWPDDFNAEDN